MNVGQRSRRAMGAAIGMLGLAACAGTKGSPAESGSGHLSVALTAAAGGHLYRLRDAMFDVSGPTPTTLSSETDAGADLVSGLLSPGDYVVALRDGWRLEREDTEPAITVDAALTSRNPTSPLPVRAGRTTPVVFQFSTSGVPVTFGKLDISIQVNEVEAGALPQFDLVVEPASLAMDLGGTAGVTLTIVSSNGFTGPVDLSGQLSGDGDASLTGWSLSFDRASVDVPPDGSATAHATFAVPALNQGLAAKASFTASGLATLGVHSAAASIAVANRYTIDVGVTDAPSCVYPASAITSLRVGTLLRWRNTSSTQPFVMHVDENASGCSHQNPGSPTPAGQTYDCTLTAPSSAFNWYCHSPGPTVAGLQVQVLP
jgi:hypothetical protein